MKAVLLAFSVLALVTLAGASSRQVPTLGQLGGDERGTSSSRLVSTGTAVEDDVAYRVLFRIVASPQMQSNPRALRAYLRRAGLGSRGCDDCPDRQRDGDDAEVTKLLAIARGVQDRSRSAEREVRAELGHLSAPLIQHQVSVEQRASFSTQWRAFLMLSATRRPRR